MEIARFDPDRHEPHAVVREEDIQLVLTADMRPRPTAESLDALETAALRDPGHPPGSVVVRPGRPLELLAIVHDLDREPSWRPEWVADALDAVFREAHRCGLSDLRVPLPGTVHGRLARGDAVRLLVEALERAGEARPRALWLDGVPDDTIEAVRVAVGGLR